MLCFVLIKDLTWAFWASARARVALEEQAGSWGRVGPSE